MLILVKINKSKYIDDMYNGINEELNNEALKVLKMIDTWLPAIEDGKPVESTLSVPVTFKVQ